jgi:hypothetical protein
MKTILFQTSCKDITQVTLLENGKPIKDFFGYVPDMFCSKREIYKNLETRNFFADCILEINLETGQILNWNPNLSFFDPIT